MKTKLLTIISILFLALCLVACGGDEKIDVNTAKAYYNNTIDAYKSAKSVDVKFSYNDNTSNQTVEFKYVLEDNKIKELAYVVTNLNGELSIYVKDDVAYMNAYGTKSKTAMTDENTATYMEKYTFKNVINEVTNLFGYTFYTGANLVSAGNGKIKLDCDLSLLSADPSLDDDALFDMEENIEKLQAKKSLTVEYEYSDKLLTKLVGVVTEQDDSTKTFTVEFKGTSANITFPSFDDYKDAE